MLGFDACPVGLRAVISSAIKPRQLGQLLNQLSEREESQGDNREQEPTAADAVAPGNMLTQGLGVSFGQHLGLLSKSWKGLGPRGCGFKMVNAD